MTTVQRVVKLGGSLLDWPPWPDQFRRWLGLEPPARTLLLTGGGAPADWLRQTANNSDLGEETCHWLAIRMMGLTARLAAALLPEAKLIDDLSWVLSCDQAAGLWLLDPWKFLEAEEHNGNAKLPHSWDVTSDSIAARLATCLQASELVLLKSSLPSGTAYCDAAREGFVDRHFPIAAAGLQKVDCINLRRADLAAIVLKPRLPADPTCSGHRVDNLGADRFD